VDWNPFDVAYDGVFCDAFGEAYDGWLCARRIVVGPGPGTGEERPGKDQSERDRKDMRDLIALMRAFYAETVQ
jgi:hypothetical protein